MNTKKIADKLITSEREEYWINLIKSKKYDEDFFYSNLDFIETFKDKGWEHWIYVVFKSQIPLYSLFYQFGEYLIDKKLYNQINRCHNMVTWIIDKRITDYNYEYLKYITKNNKSKI